MKHKKIYISVIILVCVLIFNFNQIRVFSKSFLSHEIKIYIKEIFFGKEYLKEVNFYRQLGYNQLNLPNTQFDDMILEKFKLEDIGNSSTHYKIITGKKKSPVKRFFVEDLDNGILIATASGKFQFSENYDFNIFTGLKTNLEKFNIKEIIDIKKINDEIYISYVFKKLSKDNCSYIGIANSKIDLELLNFESFYGGRECTTATNVLGGRIYPYKHNDTDGFLITTGAADKEKNLAQIPESFFGKIWFFSLDKNKKILFSRGHRNPQGLIVYNKNIISTEHGPYGGDEINNIKFNSNYGFPISSYGEPYAFKKKKNLETNYSYKKNHLDMGFVEPIFSFVPSIGISEIEKIPNNFSKYWQENFLVTSLNGRKIYRIKFDDEFNKIIYMEPMFLGERIRDIKYIKKKNFIILALEETGSLGVLRAK